MSKPSHAPDAPGPVQAARPLSPAQLLDALDPDQRAVAEHLEGALCVLAGAGTGKTRAITYRIAHGVAVGAYHPHQLLALSRHRQGSQDSPYHCHQPLRRQSRPDRPG